MVAAQIFIGAYRLSYNILILNILRTLKGAATTAKPKIGFIGQPLKVAIMWQPEGCRYKLYET